MVPAINQDNIDDVSSQFGAFVLAIQDKKLIPKSRDLYAPTR